MKKLAAFALFAVLAASAAPSIAQTTGSNPYSWMPMFSFWGSQATSVPATQTPQSGQSGAITSMQELWSLMPMFQFMHSAR